MLKGGWALFLLAKTRSIYAQFYEHKNSTDKQPGSMAQPGYGGIFIE